MNLSWEAAALWAILLWLIIALAVALYGLVPRAASSPELGRRFLQFLMSVEGQSIMARQLQIASINPDVRGENTAHAMQEALGDQLRPVPVSPGLMVYLDQAKRARTIARCRAPATSRGWR